MKIEESKDGTLKVVELDPTKWYWCIVSEDECTLATKRRDGMVLFAPARSRIQIMENADRVQPEGA